MSQKLLKKLVDKKYRDQTGLFLVEGRKSILELLSSDFEIETLYSTLEFGDELTLPLTEYETRTGKRPEVIYVTEEKLSGTGTFRSNNAGVAIVQQRTSEGPGEMIGQGAHSFVLVLDDIRDPGNLGTIIRTADWFGITHIVTSETTVDFYNPKVIAASMGSFTRTHVHSLPLLSFLQEAKKHSLPVLGALLSGNDIASYAGPDHGLIVMGSESHGIDETLQEYITEAITIPRRGQAESLNVAIATGIILSALRR